MKHASKQARREDAITVRPATREDARRMAVLSAQLGYPSSPKEIKRRLSHFHPDEDAVYVAEGSDRKVLGWVHVFLHCLVESDPQAEIGGLVVDEANRGTGVGKLLMKHAEQWAREKGLRSVYLRSNIIRKDAHTFYQKCGYSIIKTQHAFRKNLEAQGRI